MVAKMKASRSADKWPLLSLGHCGMRSEKIKKINSAIQIPNSAFEIMEETK